MCHTCQVSSDPLSRPVCILGLGLIGGSLLRALADANIAAYGYNRSASGARAAQKEGFDASTDLTATLERAATDDAIVVIATPMQAAEDMLDAIQTHAPNCGFTDVMSVKHRVYQMVRDRGMAERYVGGHPMAGTADSGWKASFPQLFRGAPWVITFDYALDGGSAGAGFGVEAGAAPAGVAPAKGASERVGAPQPSKAWIRLWSDVARMAQAVGAEVIPARVAQHDQAVARISHLPHVLAETLAIVGDHGGALTLSLAAGSFRDGSRVAGTAPHLVQAMCETNADALLTALDETLDTLADVRRRLSALRSSDARAGAGRDGGTPGSGGRPDAGSTLAGGRPVGERELQDAPSDVRDSVRHAEVGDLREFIEAGHRSRLRYEARSGNRPEESVSPVTPSTRPVFRLLPGTPGWISQLKQAENLGARIEVIDAPRR